MIKIEEVKKFAAPVMLQGYQVKQIARKYNSQGDNPEEYRQ